MSVTINQILDKKPFNTYKLSAGAKGVNNVVDYISVLETEPDQNNEVLPRTRVIYLSSLYYQRTSLNLMMEYFEYLINLQASCLIVIDDYIKEFPQEVLDYCDENSLPLLLVDHNIPYADMISTVMELIVLSQQEKLMENRLILMETGALPTSKTMEMLYELNIHFKSKVTGFFVNLPQINTTKKILVGDLIDSISSNQNYFACRYKQGVILLCSHSEMTQSHYEDFVTAIVNSIHRIMPNAVIGISNDLLLADCGDAIFQALSCIRVNKTNFITPVIRYNDLGLFKLLSSFMGSKEMEQFYSETIGAIQKYDKQYNSQLFKTIEIFIRNDCSYGKTARELVIHENTIRYRVERIKDLLHFHNSDMELFHTLDVAYKIYLLKH